MVMIVSKRKHLTLAERIMLLEYYEKINASARALVDKFIIGRNQTTDLIKYKDLV
jgi:hypothetical protein